MMLESVKTFKDTIEDDKERLFMSAIFMTLNKLPHCTTVVEKQKIYFLTKIILQLLQLKQKDNVEKMLLNSNAAFNSCLSISMTILKTEDSMKDSQLVSASILMELLKTIDDDDDDDDARWMIVISSCFRYLLGNIRPDASSSLNMGSVVLCGTLLAHADPSKLASPMMDGQCDEAGRSSRPFTEDGCRPNDATPNVFDLNLNSFTNRASEMKRTPFNLFFFIYKLASSSCKSSPHLHYQSLKLLQQWFHILSLHWESFQLSFPLDSVRDEVLGLVLTHVDSQIDGVDRNAVDLLTSLLDSLDRISSTDVLFSDSHDSFKSSLYHRLSLLPWHTKSKYLLLKPLMDHVSDDLEVNVLMFDLGKCLSTNHLAPSSSTIYKKFLSNFKTKSEQKKWNEHCCPHLINALTCSKSLDRKNAVHYWLPSTLQLLPESLGFMICCLDRLERILFPDVELPFHDGSHFPRIAIESLNSDVSPSAIVYARLSILYAAKMNGLPYKLPLRDLEYSLKASSNDLRIAALNLICLSPGTTDCPTAEDAKLLKTNAAHQMSVDDPAFRREMEKCLRSICVRCRDRGLLQLRVQEKRKKRNEVCLDDAIVDICTDLIDSLWQTCVESISPCSNFQRLHSSLAWMNVILGSFVVGSNRNIRKGIVPGDIDLFNRHARQVNRCDFFDETSATSLLGCVFNEVDEISEMATEILRIYFPWPLKCQSVVALKQWLDVCKNNKEIEKDFGIKFHSSGDAMTSCDNMDSWLLNESLGLCNNFRARESSCGVVLGKLIFSRTILEQRTVFRLSRSGGCLTASKDSLESSPSSFACGLSFLEQLLDVIVEDFESAIVDVVSQSSCYPLHGLMSLYSGCLRRLPPVRRNDAEFLERLLRLNSRTIGFVQKLVDSTLDIFGGRLLSDATAPSFEQMSHAIMDLIETSRSTMADNGDGVVVDVSQDNVVKMHQMVTSWCWINIKEAGLTLGVLMRNLRENIFTTVASLDVESIGRIFYKILTQCRHRGAIDSCTLGLLEFCSSVLQSSDVFLFNLPITIVNQVFDQLVVLSEASTTRRSAGLPSIIQTVLVSEAKLGQTTLLKRVMRRLLEIASNGMSDRSLNEQKDNPQVHAMNIMRSLVHESCLSDAMSQFLESAILIVLQGFDSDDWSIRNASLQLFGSLIPRMLGEKTTSDEMFYATNSSEFSLRFPRFFQSVVEILNGETERMKKSLKLFVDSSSTFSKTQTTSTSPSVQTSDLSLVPILSVLSRLAPSYQLQTEGSSLENHVCFLVQNLCQSRMVVVRELSAKVLAAFVRHDGRLFELLHFVVTLLPAADAPGSRLPSNHIHGLLHQLLMLYTATCHCLSGDELALLKNLLQTRSPLLTHPCLLIRAYYLKVLSLWCPESKLLIKNVENILIKSQFNDKVGLAFYQQTLVNVWLSAAGDQRSVTDRIISCLKSGYTEVRQSCLQWVFDNCNVVLESNDNAVNSLLWDLLEDINNNDKSEMPWPTLCLALNVLQKLDTNCLETINLFNKKWMILMNICRVVIPNGGELLEDSTPGKAEQLSAVRSAKTYTPSRLALELLSQLFLRSLLLKMHNKEDIMEKTLTWSGIILWCSKCTRNLDLRKSSVDACRAVVPACFEFISHHHQQHHRSDCTTILIRLLEAVLIFLTDNDTDIRMSASEMVSLVSQKIMKTSLSPAMHYEIAMKLWLQIMMDASGKSPKMLQFLYHLLEDDQTFESLKHLKNMCELDEIFLAEDDNPHFEADQLHRCIAEQLMTQNPFECAEADHIRHKVLSLQDKINVLLKFITSSDVSLEIISNKKLSISLSSIHWQHQILRKFFASVDCPNKHCRSTMDHLNSFDSEIKFLFYFWKKFGESFLQKAKFSEMQKMKPTHHIAYS